MIYNWRTDTWLDDEVPERQAAWMDRLVTIVCVGLLALLAAGVLALWVIGAMR